MKNYLSAIFLLLLPFIIKAQTISLSGTWQFEIDPNDKGITEKWFLKTLPETVLLLGTMSGSGKGNAVTVDTKWTGDIIDKSYYTSSKYEQYRQPGNINKLIGDVLGRTIKLIATPPIELKLGAKQGIIVEKTEQL